MTVIGPGRRGPGTCVQWPPVDHLVKSCGRVVPLGRVLDHELRRWRCAVLAFVLDRELRRWRYAFLAFVLDRELRQQRRAVLDRVLDRELRRWPRAVRVLSLIAVVNGTLTSQQVTDDHGQVDRVDRDLLRCQRMVL